VLLSPDLQEITPSEAGTKGKSVADIFHEVQRFFKASETSWDEPYLGGESFRQVQERGVRFLNSVLSQEDWQTLLVVAHGGFNNAMLAYATGVTGGRLFNIEQDFGCINIIDFTHGRPFLRLANFTLYDQLKVKLRTHSLDVILSLLRQKGIV
jgi:broad specificity phosphatase PhoE